VRCPAGVTIELTGLADLPAVDGDAGQLRQVLVNLLENAVFAAAPTGTVTVRGRSEPGGVTLEVEDTGAGVDPAIRRRLFEPLITTKDHGIGLGLALCKRIAERHGGDVTYADRLGGGARFSLHLPG
jgi:signal transduction histidine kinase